MPYPKLIGALAVAALLAGCTSMIEQRISTHQETWQKLSPRDQQRLRNGIVLNGDTEEIVRIALGPPDDVLSANPPDDQQRAVWVYYLSDGVGDGLHPPSPYWSGIPDDRRVTFWHGRVVDATQRFVMDSTVRVSVPPLAGGSNNPVLMRTEAQLNKLDETVGLTPEQRDKARVILEKEAAALNGLAPVERPEKTRPIRQTAQNDLRALLTPEQRQRQDNFRQLAQGREDATQAARAALAAGASSGPGFGGQGKSNTQAQLDRLDDTVGLTAEQRRKAQEILEKEMDALNQLAPADRPEKGRPFRQAAMDSLQELLTSEQRQKQDKPNRTTQLPDGTERVFVANFVRASKSIAARLGPVASLALLDSFIRFSGNSRVGRCSYTVLGEKNTEILKIYWEKSTASAPMKIVKVEAADGTLIPL